MPSELINILTDLFQNKLFGSPILFAILLIFILMILLMSSGATKYVVLAFLLLLVAGLSQYGYLPSYIYPLILIAAGLVWAFIIIAAVFRE